MSPKKPAPRRPARSSAGAERALRLAEQRLRDLLDPLGLLGVLVGADGRVAYCNDRFLTLTGWTREEAVGRPWLELAVPEDSRGIVAPVLERVFRSRSAPPHFEHAVLTRDGRRRLVDWSHTVLRGPAGEVTALACLGEDVTERRMAEEALRSSEERFRALFAVSVDAIFLVDVETRRVRDANPAAERLYGYARDELLDLAVTALCAEPDATAEWYRGLTEGQEPGPLSFRRASRRQDGSTFLAHVTNHLHHQRGRPVVWAVVRDVTDAVRAEEALRAANERFDATLRALPDLLFVLDAERRIVDFRAPDPAALYVTAERFLNRTPEESLPAAAAAVVSEAVEEADRSGSHYGAVYSLALPAGRRWYELSITRSGDPGSPDRRFIALVRDITAQHTAEEQLRTSEQLNRALVEGAGASIALFDPDGRVLHLNSAAADLISGSPVDLVGRPMREVRTVLDQEVLAARLAEVVRTAAARQYEDVVRLPSGKRCFLSKWQPLRDADGALTGVQLLALDITERRDAEGRERALADKLQQTQKLESLGVLAGGIAHDFNNLLSGILGNADLALLELPPGAPARQPLEQVLQGARRAAELTKQMLAYSGKGRFLIETVQLPDLVAEMGKLLEVSISKKSVLRYEFGDDLPSVDADVAQIRQVLMNLIINASEAIGDRSGVIALRVGATHCDAAELATYILGETLRPGLYLSLEVADTGAGMTPEVLARIFEPFYSTKFAGRGLGLAAVLGIVRGHRGAIRIASEPGHGTTFRIVLPASTREAAARDRTSGPHEWTATGTVLVVDDEETVLATTRRMLERMGFRVLAARGGSEALALLEGHAGGVGVVLLDLTMPDMDGVQVHDEIRRRDATVPIVLSSGYSEQEVRPRFEGRGEVGFVQKPYGYEALFTAMRSALGA